MNLPSREECEAWEHAQVAFFLSRNKMQDCAATVNKLKMNGLRLLSLSDSDMSKFSLIHQPQLQKIVLDIKKNDGSLLNKLKRLKSKPSPKVPTRDYRDTKRDEELSDMENDMYEDPRGDQDDSYEPPPSHIAFTATPSASLAVGEYLDNRRKQPIRPPRMPLSPGKRKQLPPEPTETTSDAEDYVSPNCSIDDDNYVEPEENPSPDPVVHAGARAGKERPMLHTPLAERPPSPDFYEVPDKEENSLSLPASRACPIPTRHFLPPRPSPRGNRERPPAIQEPAEDDEYEVCEPADNSRDKPADRPSLPRPLSRDRSPKPSKPVFKPREFESRTLPAKQSDQKPPPKAFTLDMKWPKIPFPPLTPPKPANRGSVTVESGSTDQDMDSDLSQKPWYASACDRRTADNVLCRSNKDGAFMVRKSSGQDAQQPYTLVVFYNSRVYNIPIRFIATTQHYALGREKRGEEHFSSVSQIIENHQRTPLVLIDSQSNAKDTTKLRFPSRP
ncbi:B-cell linker protein isoform X1 [Pungitius pungitius]|uniref:B-cell linker protein isoform X1 n=1 Tax=Pungitius pungitius TaxID=134920 RepID=UPI001888A771|nr:B-cell linker protein isoform X1 [Pungitius pungitius]